MNGALLLGLGTISITRMAELYGVTGQAVTDSSPRMLTLTQSAEAGRSLQEIVARAQAVAREVESVSAIAEEMANAVNSVREAVRTATAVSSENELSVREMADGARLVGSTILTVASISKESPANTEQVSAAAQEVSANAQSVTAAIQEQTASIELIGFAARELSEMSGGLRELVSQFRLRESEHAPELRVVDGGLRIAA